MGLVLRAESRTSRMSPDPPGTDDLLVGKPNAFVSQQAKCKTVRVIKASLYYLTCRKWPFSECPTFQKMMCNPTQMVSGSYSSYLTDFLCLRCNTPTQTKPQKAIWGFAIASPKVTKGDFTGKQHRLVCGSCFVARWKAGRVSPGRHLCTWWIRFGLVLFPEAMNWQ